MWYKASEFVLFPSVGFSYHHFCHCLDLAIRSSHRMHLLNDSQILRIDQLRPEDAGLYTCTAENPLQRISAATDLRVRDPSKNSFCQRS